MTTSVLICSTKYGGCGTVDLSPKFKSGFGGDWLICPSCYEDHCFQLLNENIKELTNTNNYEKARELLDKHYYKKSE